MLEPYRAPPEWFHLVAYCSKFDAMKRLLLALCMCLFASAVWAQGFAVGFEAYQSGDYARAFRIWKPLADRADTSAQYNIGLMYANGLGVPRNDAEAVKWFRLAAKAGIAGALANLGFMYEAGLGVAQDNSQAVSWYGKAAEKGDAFAQNSLGLMYDEGRGVEQDDEIAVGLYRQSADQGLVEAQNNLGYMYEVGRGVPQDDVESVKWYRRAADQDFAAAQFNLALKYDGGRGVPQDDSRAYMWYTIALTQLPVEQLETAVSLRNVVAERMAPDSIVNADRLAKEWLKKRGRDQ